MTLEDLYRLLRSGHVQAQGVVDTLDAPLLVLDHGLRVLVANPSFLRVFKTDREATLGNAVFDLGDGQWDIPELRELLSAILPRAAAVVDYEVAHDFPGVGRRTFLVTARKLSHPDDTSQQILVTFDDVTKKRREDHAKEVVVNEIRHRMKNILAIVQALANRTATEGVSAEQFRTDFLGRLNGLAVAQELTLGESEAIDLESLVARVLQPHADQIRIEPGPGVHLSTRQVQPLGMILHELATNAAKYGSLSVEGGRVDLHWTEAAEGETRSVRIDWREENGPPVEPPGREGFGTTLIRQTASFDLQGHVDLAYEPHGLRARIDVPIAAKLS